MGARFRVAAEARAVKAKRERVLKCIVMVDGVLEDGLKCCLVVGVRW